MAHEEPALDAVDPSPAQVRAEDGAFWALAHRFRTDLRLTLLLMVPNAVGIAFGYYYYWDVGQFDASSRFYQPVWWWPFVADSPNALVLMSAALLLWHAGVRSRLLDALAFLHMVYVGLWTTLLFSLHPAQLGTFDWGGTNNVLFFTHMLMPVQALVLVPTLRRRAFSWPLLAALAAWGTLNLWLDYGPLALRPAPFVQAHPLLASGSVLLMLAAWAAVVYVLGRRMWWPLWGARRPAPPP